MQQFSELDDEIGADDWIIPEKEISRRILIKQTPRYNIYKADWYGDVIVYEPISAQQRQVHQHHHYAMTSNSTGNGIRQARFDHLELCDRLSQLDLGLAKRSKLSQSQQSLSSDQYPDSAYSSISSTPRNHTKNIKSEFEFPSGTPVLALSLSSPSTSVTGSLTIDENNNSACDAYSTPQDVCGERESWMQSTDNSERQTKHETSQLISPPTLLNRDSYNFGHVAQSASGSISDAANHQVEEVQQSSWFELNELRLIAHESFMLFMGASMDEAATTSRHNVSLVMQISQPKAVSLYNLLHATKFASSSPIDRFFAAKQQRQHLSLDAKLNICQQVTNAMTYLHDKNIVHGKLTSVNIYIELNQRVKISLIDNDEAPIAAVKSTTQHSSSDDHNNNNNNTAPADTSVAFNLPSLTYLSPELVKSIRIASTSKPRHAAANHCYTHAPVVPQIDTNRLTTKSDVFSFGTVLFELFEEQFPFAAAPNAHSLTDTTRLFNSPTALLTPNNHTPKQVASPRADSPFNTVPSSWNGNIHLTASELIYQIGSGKIYQCNTTTKCTSLIDSYIAACWSCDPKMRPQFKQLAFVE